MRALLRLAHFIDAISEKAGDVSTITVLVVVVIGFYNVFVRYLGRFIGIQLSSNVFIEIQWYLYSLIFLSGFAYILKHGDNVRVDLFYARWSRRTKAWIDLLGTALFVIPFCLVGITVAIKPVLVSWGQQPDGSWGLWEMSPDPSGLPRAPIKTMIIMGFVLLLLQAISQTIKYIALLRGNMEVLPELTEDSDIHELLD